MEIRHIRAFVAVAEELNFTRAASGLFLAQQALSSQIRQLENEVGARLFDRSTRRVELTEAGEVFAERAAKILASIDEAAEAVRRVGRGDALHLHIGYSHSFGIESLPLILNELHLAAPEVTVTSVVALADHALSGLLQGEFDLAVVRSPLLPPTIESVVLRNEPLGVIVGDRHPAAQSEVIHADQLAESTILMWPRGHSPGYADKVLAAFGRGPSDDLVYIFETFTPDGFLGDKRALAMLASGQAFQTAMKTHYDPVPAGFVWRPLEPRLDISVELIRRQGATTRAQRLFIDVAKSVSQMNDWLDEDD